MGCDMSFIKKVKMEGGRDGDGGLEHEKRVLMLGLDNAGKTSLLFQMRDN
jgi:GTPase SAR1 family protein